MPLYFVPLVLSDSWKAANYRGYFFMKEIVINSPKYGKKIVLVDDDDFNFLSKLTWHVAKRKYTFYAETRINKRNISMHRLLIGFKYEVIDHIDADGLNNQRYNLRGCSQSQNLANMRLSTHNTSGFKGVCKTKQGRYHVGIYLNNKRKHIGCFTDPIEAAKAYNESAIKYYGEFARLNEIPCAV